MSISIKTFRRPNVAVLDTPNVAERSRFPVEETVLTRNQLLQTITRDLWALRLRRLQNRVSYDSETDTEGQSQVFSSQSEGESVNTQTTRGSRKKRQVKTDGAVNLSETLAICYVGTLLLRVPFTVMDMLEHVDNGDIPYYQASKAVPGNLKERLPAEFQVLLEPQTILRASKLHQRALEMAALLSTEFGMVLPPVNHPLLLYRWMHDMALPIEVYAATQRLSRILGVDFTLELGSHLRRPNVLRYPEVRLMALLVVSTKLFFPIDDIHRHPVSATDLSVLKMDWATWVDAHSSTQASHNGGDSDNNTNKNFGMPRMTFPEAFGTSESDCLAMSDEGLDRYLDWYEENLTSENVREHGRAGRDADFRRTLMRMFPTQSSRIAASSDPLRGNVEGEGEGVGKDTNLTSETSDSTRRLRQVQHALRPKKIIVSAGVEEEDGGADVPRAGSYYRRYREAKDLDGPARVLYSKAAELAGVSLDEMTKAVLATERKLQKSEEHARKGKGGRLNGDNGEDHI